MIFFCYPHTSFKINIIEIENLNVITNICRELDCKTRQLMSIKKRDRIIVIIQALKNGIMQILISFNVREKNVGKSFAKSERGREMG